MIEIKVRLATEMKPGATEGNLLVGIEVENDNKNTDEANELATEIY